MPLAAVRPGSGAIVVPADRRIDRCLPDPDRTSRLDAINENA